MEKSRADRIVNALQSYRTRVLQHNILTLRIIIEELEARPAPPGVSKELAQTLRMRALADDYLRGDILDLSSTPAGLLREEIRETLVERFTLDGVVATDADPQILEQYFADLQRAITDESSCTASIPPDLISLCSQAREVLGSGLPNTRSTQQIDILSNILQHPPKSRILLPETDEEGIDGVWDDWEVSVAVKIGDAPVSWGGSFVVFCRNTNEGREAPWSWRYGLHNEDSDSDLFVDLAEFMDWHVRSEEVKEEELRRTILSLSAWL